MNVSLQQHWSMLGRRKEKRKRSELRTEKGENIYVMA
jgi:hypothetical protein